MVPAMSRVFAETPWTDYTTLLIFDSTFGGGSALEHSNSHVGIYNPGFIGTPILASITAHEIFHAWNVKRLRPAEMVPYRYDAPQPTTLLWVSEGITDYYADLALLRGGVIDSTVFLNVTVGKLAEIADAPPVALEDASLSTWIHPADGTHTIYYPKGSLAGLLLDVLIRDGSENRRSLDDVLRELYRTTYKSGRGFSDQEWWNAVAAAAGRPFADFHRKYVDGREPFPWASVAPLAGLRYVADTIREPRLGIATVSDSGAETVASVAPGSSAEAAGILPGDELVSIGPIKVDRGFGVAFRTLFRRRIGETAPVVVRRGGKELTLSLMVQEATRVEERLDFDRRASFKALRIRAGLLRGTTER
jgi:predicted metalloprotease with PDZ domain